MIRRILALVKKEFLHLKNDWWLPLFMILGGALELLAIGYWLGNFTAYLKFTSDGVGYGSNPTQQESGCFP